MKNIFVITLLILSARAFAVSPVGTPSPTAPPTADDVARKSKDAVDKTKDAVGTTVDYAKETGKETKDEFEARMHKNLRATRKAIRNLKAKAQTSTAATKKQIEAQVADLQDKQRKMRAKLNEVSSSSASAWHDVSQGVTHAWDDVKNSVNKAADEFHTDDKVSDQ